MEYGDDDDYAEMRQRQALARRRQQDRGDISINVRKFLPKPGPKMAMGVVW